MLAEMPSVRELVISHSPTKVKEFANVMQQYFADRLGFREDMIKVKQLIEIEAFDDPAHPSYTFGKDGHIFFKVGRKAHLENDFVTTYSDYITKMSNYCEERSADFYFTINPDKRELYSDYLPAGAKYDTGDEEEIINRVVQSEVNYIDIRGALFDAKTNGFQVCSKQQDPGHWNDTGTYYGVTKILEEMHQDNVGVLAIPQNRFDISFQKSKTLNSTQIPIDEEISVYTLRGTKLDVVTDLDDEIRLPNHAYTSFVYYKNPGNPNAPKLLSLNGSHINPMAQNYLTSQFSEAVFIWSYYNIDNLPYYFNIFQPDVVLYEVAERTISNANIDIPSLKESQLQPSALKFADLPETNLDSITDCELRINDENDLADVSFIVHERREEQAQNIKYAYLMLDGVWYDFTITSDDSGEEHYTVTLPSAVLRNCEKADVMLVPEEMDSKQIAELTGQLQK